MREVRWVIGMAEEMCGGTYRFEEIPDRQKDVREVGRIIKSLVKEHFEREKR